MNGNERLAPRYWTNRRPASAGGLIALLAMAAAAAGQTQPAANDANLYQVSASLANIAPTAGSTASGAPPSGAMAEGKVEVIGSPRMTKGHPCTFWDQEDIEHYKAMLKTSPELQAQYAGLKRAMDARLEQPLGIPQPKKGEGGKWLHLGSLEPFGETTYGAIHDQLSLDIANLGAVYVLSGEAKYGEFCKRLLLAYADAFPNYGIGARPGFTHDPSIIHDQRLSDAICLIPSARGYDLIHDLPSITPEERRHIEEGFLKADARHIANNAAHLTAPTNWSAIGTAAVLMVGCATDDQSLIDLALYGPGGTKDRPTGGVDLHFSAKSIDEDGMWAEGAMGYQFMALEALITDAEVLWHRGIDMYRYRDCALKRLFDTPLRLAYPDLTAPAQHDSGHGSIISGDCFLYEFAYRRYRDPAYLLILNQMGMHIDSQGQKFPVSVLYDREANGKAAPAEWKSVNFFGVGYGIERLTTPAGTSSLLLDYGPNRSHGHPDKLNLDFYAFNAQLIPDPGMVWYELPLYRLWYHTTLAHNTLCVDEQDQKMCGARQIVYAPADTLAMQRAACDQAYAGVRMDRSLFMTPQYLADIFGAFADKPHKMDLAWHVRGAFSSELKTEPMEFAKPAPNGYSQLTSVRHAATDKPWSANVTNKGNVARFLAAGGTPTDVIVADGIYGIEKPPTVIERRNAASTVYGNVVDVSGAKDGYVKGVTIEGGLEQGYVLMKIKTAVGEDICFVSYRPGTYKVGGIETDAQEAMIVKSGDRVTAMYLGGGTALKTEMGWLSRSGPGLVFIEKAETGAYILGNPSPADASITCAHPAIAGIDVFELDSKGQRAKSIFLLQDAEGVYVVVMKAGSKIEFAPKGAQSIYDYRQAMLAKRQAEQEEALSKARNECIARDKVRLVEAKDKPAPAGTILAVQAEDFSAEGDGNVGIVSTKRAAIGKCINQWDNAGHWLEWTFDAPAEGYYYLTLCYCSELDKIEREITVNGEVQEPFAQMVLPSTGGWAIGSDDWRLYTAVNPVNDQPLLIKLKAGKNVIRLTNLNGRGANVDWLAVTSPDVKIDREALAGKLKK